MKIVELKIDDSIISGFDATALVESPAIEENFIAFNSYETKFCSVSKRIRLYPSMHGKK